jgi:hypothetical protein
LDAGFGLEVDGQHLEQPRIPETAMKSAASVGGGKPGSPDWGIRNCQREVHNLKT